MCGGSLERAMPAACAVEMIHNYSLIHDDLPAMDNDDVRRGRPTCHIQFDEATAILAGDALIPMAFEILGRDIRPHDVAARCVTALARASGPSQLVGGQADDLGFQFSPADVESLERIHHRKTGALIAVSLEIGARVAGANVGKLTYPAVLGEEKSELRAREVAQAAIDALAPFGERARPLELLARFVIDRTQ